jgi:hypothetical protein
MKSDFIDLIKQLVKAKVDFVIIGGFAGVVHGCTYVTQDMDICCDFTPENLLRLQKAIADFHPVHRMTPKRQKLHLTKKNCETLKNLYLDTDIGQLDCISFVDGVGDYQQAKNASGLIKVEVLRLPVLGLDALIKAKKAMNRPRDRHALIQLEAAKKLKKQKM